MVTLGPWMYPCSFRPRVKYCRELRLSDLFQPPNDIPSRGLVLASVSTLSLALISHTNIAPLNFDDFLNTPLSSSAVGLAYECKQNIRFGIQVCPSK